MSCVGFETITFGLSELRTLSTELVVADGLSNRASIGLVDLVLLAMPTVP